MSDIKAITLDLPALRAQVLRLEHVSGRRASSRTMAFGVDEIDDRLPNGGISLGALHEITGAGADTEQAAVATLMAAGMTSRMTGSVVWVLGERDIFPPALAAVGLHPDRLLIAEAGRDVLLVMEECLRHQGVAAVVGEISGRLTLTASRRLQLAAEQSGVTAIALRRSRKHDDPALSEPSAALTRWRVASIPSPPPLPRSPQTPGLGPSLWRLDLTRCRGGGPASWTVEACDEKGYLHLAADMAHRSPAPEFGFLPAARLSGRHIAA